MRSPPGIAELKSVLRTQVRGELDKISQSRRRSESERACARLLRRACWRQAKAVLFYMPLPDELDLTPLWQAAAAAGKVIALLRHNSSEQGYEACRLDRPDAPLVRGRFGIFEPGPSCPGLPLNQLDLILVPGLAFDASGRRLGRGKGYYDRLLRQVRGIRCGVAFDQQILAEIPAEAHDVKLNCILTPTRWLDCGPSAAGK